MKILITGTAGFIGYHLAERLLREGHEIVGYDNFNEYYPVLLKRARNAELLKHKGFRSVEGALDDYPRFRALVGEVKPTVLCHLAGQAGVRWSLTHPFEYQKSNLDGFLSVLECCRHEGVERLVYASSSSVYGNNRKLPFSEEDKVDHPISLYAATKKANELMAHTYSHLYGLQTIGLRFFTVYGPWSRPDMATWMFTHAIATGKPIKVFNHGEMQRDFTYVDDIISGVCGAIFAEGLEKYELFNIGNNQSEKLMDMITLLGKALGAEPIMELLPMQPGDVPATYADIERARSRLGFSPSTPLEVGLKRFVDWFVANRPLVEAVQAEMNERSA